MSWPYLGPLKLVEAVSVFYQPEYVGHRRATLARLPRAARRVCRTPDGVRWKISLDRRVVWRDGLVVWEESTGRKAAPVR